MNRILYTKNFIKEAKQIKKKHRLLKKDLILLENKLLQNPRLGTPIGADIYKIRIANSSKSKGKSGGFRVITYIINEDRKNTNINMITIYDKSKISNIPKFKILALIEAIFG